MDGSFAVLMSKRGTHIGKFDKFVCFFFMCSVWLQKYFSVTLTKDWKSLVSGPFLHSDTGDQEIKSSPVGLLPDHS